MKHNIIFAKIVAKPSKTEYTVLENNKELLISFSGKSGNLAAKYLCIGKTIAVSDNEFHILTPPKTGKEKWMLDFLSTKEVVTAPEQIETFLKFYSRDIRRDILPEAVFVFEDNYFITKQAEKYIIDSDGEHHEFNTLEMAELCIADIELDDNDIDQIYLHREPENSLITAVETELIGEEDYHDIIVLKNGTTIRITNSFISISKDRDETELIGQIRYQ